MKILAGMLIGLLAPAVLAAGDPGRAAVETRMLNLVRDTALADNYAVQQRRRIEHGGEAAWRRELQRMGLRPASEPGLVAADWTGRSQPADRVLVMTPASASAGVATALGVIKVFSTLRLKPRRTVRLVIRPAGTAATAADAIRPPAPGEIALIDAVPSGHPGGIRARVGARGAAALEPVRSALEKIGAGRVELDSRPTLEAALAPLRVSGLPWFQALPGEGADADGALRRHVALVAMLAWQLGETGAPPAPARPRAPAKT